MFFFLFKLTFIQVIVLDHTSFKDRRVTSSRALRSLLELTLGVNAINFWSWNFLCLNWCMVDWWGSFWNWIVQNFAVFYDFEDVSTIWAAYFLKDSIRVDLLSWGLGLKEFVLIDWASWFGGIRFFWCLFCLVGLRFEIESIIFFPHRLRTTLFCV